MFTPTMHGAFSIYVLISDETLHTFTGLIKRPTLPHNDISRDDKLAMELLNSC